jgi:hypothetical protein
VAAHRATLAPAGFKTVAAAVGQTERAALVAAVARADQSPQQSAISPTIAAAELAAERPAEWSALDATKRDSDSHAHYSTFHSSLHAAQQ